MDLNKKRALNIEIFYCSGFLIWLLAKPFSLLLNFFLKEKSQDLNLFIELRTHKDSEMRINCKFEIDLCS